MRYRAEFQRYKSDKDKDGFVTKQWEPVLSVWADITAVSSREYFSADTETAETTVKIFIRYNPKIDNTMRVVCGDSIYEIKSVLHNRRDNITTVMAKEWTYGENDSKAPGGNDEKAGAAGNGV